MTGPAAQLPLELEAANGCKGVVSGLSSTLNGLGLPVLAWQAALAPATRIETEARICVRASVPGTRGRPQIMTSHELWLGLRSSIGPRLFRPA